MTRHYSISWFISCEATSWGLPYQATAVSMVKNPGKTYVFVEEYDRRQIGAGANPGPQNGYWGCIANGYWGDCPPFWHDWGANFSFLDGHAEYRRWVGPKIRTVNLDGWAFCANYWPGNPLDTDDYMWMLNGVTNGLIR